MKDELFDELIASVREGGKILHDKIKPSRIFVINKLQSLSGFMKIKMQKKYHNPKFPKFRIMI